MAHHTLKSGYRDFASRLNRFPQGAPPTQLLVDGQSRFGHRAVAAILGALLKMPPLKQALATKQFKSRYLEALIAASAGRAS